MHSGEYRFKNPYSERLWVAATASAAQARVGGVAGTATGATLTKKAVGVAVASDAHLAAAQADFFQPLSATKNNVITGTGQAALRDRDVSWQAQGAHGRAKPAPPQPRGHAHAHHHAAANAGPNAEPALPPAVSPRASQAALDYYASVIKVRLQP